MSYYNAGAPPTYLPSARGRYMQRVSSGQGPSMPSIYHISTAGGYSAGYPPGFPAGGNFPPPPGHPWGYSAGGSGYGPSPHQSYGMPGYGMPMPSSPLLPMYGTMSISGSPASMMGGGPTRQSYWENTFQDSSVPYRRPTVDLSDPGRSPNKQRASHCRRRSRRSSGRRRPSATEEQDAPGGYYEEYRDDDDFSKIVLNDQNNEYSVEDPDESSNDGAENQRLPLRLGAPPAKSDDEAPEPAQPAETDPTSRRGSSHRKRSGKNRRQRGHDENSGGRSTGHSSQFPSRKSGFSSDSSRVTLSFLAEDTGMDHNTEVYLDVPQIEKNSAMSDWVDEALAPVGKFIDNTFSHLNATERDTLLSTTWTSLSEEFQSVQRDLS